ncbi:hypothetical protein K7X08_010435 [Anisodus acutangulus]|uniref:Uncharacterized protein n=1 Tax=Anisodus acutangulus TaxID=402998 RepID=A0A9Q1N771_9SOLA|nr:hypothetical protein K7X08_010435 [Anisodus acutangulus]
MYEAHFGIPMAGAVLNAVNVRLNADTIAFLLGHCSAAVVMVDQEFFLLAEEALTILENKSKGKSNRPLLIVIAEKNCDPTPVQYALEKGAVEFEKFLETGDPDFSWKPPQDEWQSIALGYTSGTTASPKGVVLHHRGAYCWKFAFGGEVTANAVYSAIAHLGVTHFSAAPVVLNTIVNAPKEETILPLPRLVHVSTKHCCPSTLCTWKPEWDLLPTDLQARLNARQGVRYVSLEHLDVVSPTDMTPVLADGKTMGEIVFRAILEISVVARPDEQWGESPCAFVTLNPDVKETDPQQLAEDIMKFSRSKMPKYWVPKLVFFGPFPMTTTGKIQKHLLREKAKEMGPMKKS